MSDIDWWDPYLGIERLSSAYERIPHQDKKLRAALKELLLREIEIVKPGQVAILSELRRKQMRSKK